MCAFFLSSKKDRIIDSGFQLVFFFTKYQVTACLWHNILPAMKITLIYSHILLYIYIYVRYYSIGIWVYIYIYVAIVIFIFKLRVE